MSAVRVVAPENHTDPIAHKSSWIAQHTRERLTRDGHELVSSEHEPFEGMTFIGHGDEDALLDANGAPLIGLSAAASFQGRWLYAMACDAGGRLGPRVVAAGATLFAGYRVKLNPRWRPATIPTPIVPAVIELVTGLTSALAAGTRDRRALLEQIRPALDRITLWADDHPGEATGIRLFCEQLYGELIVLPVTPPPQP